MTTLTAMPKYEAYKNSGIEWIGEIPDDWGIKKLSHLFLNIGSGTTPATGNISFYDGNISWLQTGDLTDGVINSTSKTISERALKTHSTLKQYKAGSLVVAMYGATIGKVGLLNISTATNQACCVLEKTDSVDMRFAFYLFMGFKSNIVAMGYGGGQPNISQDLIRNLRFPFPNQQLQTVIANFLDEKTAKINEAIAIKEQQIELLKERKQIIIQQAVTQGLDPTVPMTDSGVEWIGKIPAHWEVLPLKRLATLSPTVKVENRKSKELVTFLAMEKVSTSGNIEQDTFLPICNVSQGFTIFNRGDVIIAKITPCFENGKSAWLNTLATDFGYGSTEFHVVRCSQRILGSFLYLIVSSPLFLTAGEAMMTGSAGQKRVPSSFIQNFPTAIPNIEEQARIVNEVHEEFNQIDFVIQSSNYQIEKLKEYKTTLINSAVTGKIKVV